MIKQLAITVIVLTGAACTNAQPVPATVTPAQSLTLYYKESQAEPWSAKLDGALPSNWHVMATAALDGASLHPLSIETVRIAPIGTVTCFSVRCPNLHALRVVLPISERARALERCFVENTDDGTVPAIARSDCEPLYRN